MRDRSLVEVVDVAHDGKHNQKLSLRVEQNYRVTWCSKCGKAVTWERVIPMKIVIHHNDEIGRRLWSVCDENHFENWISSFETLEEAIKFVEYFEHDTYSVVCSITDCKENHSLTNDVPDTSCG